MDITIKQSKVYSSFMLALYIVFFCMMIILEGFVIDEIIDYYNANQSIKVSSLCISIVGGVFFVAFFVFSLLSVIRTMRETYTFTNDKIVKEYKQNVKWEIAYDDIQTFMISGLMLTIVYKKPYATDKPKKTTYITDDNRVGFKNAIAFHGYFNKSDLQSIKEKIAAFNTENGGNIRII